MLKLKRSQKVESAKPRNVFSNMIGQVKLDRE